MRNKRQRVKTTIFALPSLVTLLNLSLGFLSLLASVHGRFLTAAWLIILAAVMDGVDGIIARATKASSQFGVELDSLADAVSFATGTGLLLALWGAEEFGRISAAFGFIFLAAGLLRLARYNIIQGKQKDRSSYLGLTVPSASIFLASFVLIHSQPAPTLPDRVLFCLAVLATSSLMVSRIRYPNFLSRSLWRRIDLRRALFLAVVVSSLYLHPPLTLLILSSLNISSGPLREAWRLARKIFLTGTDHDEVPLE